VATVTAVLCAYVLKRFPRLSQTFVLEELLELQRLGQEIVVLAARGPGGPSPERASLLHAPLHYLPADVPESAAAPWVAEQLRSTGAEHVHAHFAGWASGVAQQAAADAGIGFSFTAHATDIYRDNVDEAALAARIEAARFVVTVTEANRQHLERLLDRHGRTGRVVRIYNGVDAARLRRVGQDGPHDGSGARGHSADRPQVLAVGRLVAKKGFDVLLDAAALLRQRGVDVRTTIVGDGPERPRLDWQVRSLGLADRVELRGALPHDDVLTLLRSSSVLAMPCVVADDGDRDALPTVILEAMALGTPVVSTRVSGVPEMLEDGHSGVLVEQRDPAGLAGALERLVRDPALSTSVADAAHAVVTERFDLTTNATALRSLLTDSALVGQAAR